MTNFCYVLWNEIKSHTYAGYTVDPIRRLRQHNGELVGGAKATSMQKGGWSFMFLIKCDTWTKQQALSFEWYLKSHRGWQSTFTNPCERRLDLLKRATSHEKFCNLYFYIWLAQDFDLVLANVNIVPEMGQMITT